MNLWHHLYDLPEERWKLVDWGQELDRIIDGLESHLPPKEGDEEELRLIVKGLSKSTELLRKISQEILSVYRSGISIKEGTEEEEKINLVRRDFVRLFETLRELSNDSVKGIYGIQVKGFNPSPLQNYVSIVRSFLDSYLHASLQERIRTGTPLDKLFELKAGVIPEFERKKIKESE